MDTKYYMRRPLSLLPIPYHQQGIPIPDPLQKHFSVTEENVVSNIYSKPNDLATGRFLGTVWPQQNEPKYLGANERVVFERAW
jgi:hypothetical protein